MENTLAPRVLRGRTKIIVPHLDGEVRFLHPAFNTDTYQNVGKAILQAGLRVPTGEEMASLLHSAYCSSAKNEPEFKNIRQIMKNNWLWAFNLNNWTYKGVYVIQDEKAEGRAMQIDEAQLEKALNGGKEIKGVRFSKDGKIRFAPKGSYVLEERKAEDLANDGFIIAGYGVEGAKKLAEVASKFRYSSSVVAGLNINEGENSEKRVSALFDYMRRGLDINCYGWNEDNKGRSFGVCN